MKKFLKLVVTLLAVSSLSGCGSNTPSSQSKSVPQFVEEKGLYGKLSTYEQYFGELTYKNKNVAVTTYLNEDKLNKSDSNPAIVYALHTGYKRMGYEQDSSIIKDLLNEFVVIVLDFYNKNNDGGFTSHEIADDLMDFRLKVKSGATFLSGIKVNSNYVYVLPAGYRIARDIEFFDITKSASKGTEDFIVNIWNQSWVKSKVGSKWVKANSIEDIVMKNGEKLYKTDENGEHPYMKYKLDIIYPSEPVEEIPVITHASTTAYRNGYTAGSDNPDRIQYIETSLRGYASVCYDHEYVPFENTDNPGWGHIQQDSDFGYSIMRYDGVKVRTAMVRCVKYYADEFGYSKNLIGAIGHSKGSWVSCLGIPDPESQDEDEVYGNYEQGENVGPQPFLKDKNGNKLTGDITCLYHSMGWGSKRYEDIATKDAVPTYIACGKGDKYGAYNYWASEVAFYEKQGIPFMYADMTGEAHTLPPNKLDPTYKYNYLDSLEGFFDYYLGKAGPSLAYTSIVSGKLVKNELVLQFNSEIDAKCLDKVLVADDAGNAVTGTWERHGGGTRYKFISDGFTSGTTYTLNMNQIVGNNDKTSDVEILQTFVY